MTKPVTGLTQWGSTTTGSTADLDANFTALKDAVNDFNTYSNYLVDTGAANAYVVTLGANLTASLAAGLLVQFKAANANTGASTINVNGTGITSILNPDGSALAAGQIPANAIVQIMYDGTQYLYLGAWQKGMVLLSTGSASSSATLDFTGLTGYSSYVFVISDIVPATDGAILWMRVSVDNGANYKAGASDYRWANFGTNDSATNGSNGDTADSEIEMSSSTGVSNDATYAGVTGTLYTGDISKSSAYHGFTYLLTEHTGTSGAESARYGSGRYISTAAALNAMRFMFSTGNIAAGTIKCYGVRG